MCDDVLSDFIMSENLEQRVCMESPFNPENRHRVKPMERYLCTSVIMTCPMRVFRMDFIDLKITVRSLKVTNVKDVSLWQAIVG